MEVSEQDPIDELEVPEPDFGSLAQRVKQRRDELQGQRTGTFELQGYEGVLAAEYRILSWPTIRKIAHRHRKIKDEGLRELYAAADTLLTACEQMVEVTPEGTYRPLGIRYGTRFAEKIGIDLAPDASPRQAILAIFDVDTRLMAHYSEYIEWQQGELQEVDQEVVQDFGRTA